MNSLIELSESIGNVYIGNNIKKTFYTPEEIEISFDYNSSRVVYNEKKDNPIDLTSFNNTLVFNLDFNYYHFLIDQLSFLLIELIKNNNLQVVFFTNNKIQNYMDYVFEKLEKYNINFYLFILESNESIKVNNYYIYNRENFNFNNQIEIDSLLVSNFLKENKEITIDAIQKMVCEFFEVPYDKLLQKTRKREIVQARQITMYLAKAFTKNSLKTIGEHFGGRDHTTVIHSCQTVKDLMDTDSMFRENVMELTQKVQLAAM